MYNIIFYVLYIFLELKHKLEKVLYNIHNKYKENVNKQNLNTI